MWSHSSRALVWCVCVFVVMHVVCVCVPQVYKAVLRDSGEEVAVKVQRPGIEPIILRDLFIFRAMGSLFNTLSRQVGDTPPRANRRRLCLPLGMVVCEKCPPAPTHCTTLFDVLDARCKV